jgi:hypothetical protein
VTWNTSSRKSQRPWRKSTTSDRESRSNQLQTRFEDKREEADSKNDKQSKTEQTDQTDKKEEPAETDQNEQTSVKDRPSVLMYLPEDQHTELDIRFDELNAQYERKHGTERQNNRDCYPAVVEAASEGKELEAVLDLKNHRRLRCFAVNHERGERINANSALLPFSTRIFACQESRRH